MIENLLSGVGRRSGWVTRWRLAEMALRWAGVASETEMHFPKIIGQEVLCVLGAAFDDGDSLGRGPPNRLDEELVSA